MDWRLKCIAFHLFSLPGGQYLHRLAQRLNGNYLRTVTDELIATYRFHLDNYRGGPALEFGAGADLLAPLLLSEAGSPIIYTYDLGRFASVEQVNHVIDQLRQRGGTWPHIEDLGQDLLDKYRIDYRAPADVRTTGLPGKSVDFIYSTSVLEHIPLRDLEKILSECNRIGSSRMRMSHNIGYIDHYAHADQAISYFNFYRYPDWQWRLFNPSMQYQNRLRHIDFERLFRKFGLSLVSSRRVMETKRLPNLPLASRFTEYSRDDLFAHDGLFCLVKQAQLSTSAADLHSSTRVSLSS